MFRLLGIMIVLLLQGCNNSESSMIELMEADDQTCPKGANVEWISWGKSGRAKVCNMRHGKFTGWEDGYKAFEAFYSYGIKEGEWHWFDKDGAVIKTITYKSGREIAN